MKVVILVAVVGAILTAIPTAYTTAFDLDQYLLGADEEVRHAVNTVFKLMEYEKSGQWDKWADLLHIRAYPDLDLGLITTNEEFKEALRDTKASLAGYEILEIAYLPEWKSIPVRPWLPQSNSPYEGEPLSETYYGVVRLKIMRVSVHGHSFESYCYVIKVDGEWKIHWSPWFALEG